MCPLCGPGALAASRPVPPPPGIALGRPRRLLHRTLEADYAAIVKPGPRDHLITEALARELSRIDPALVDREALDGAEGPLRLSRHLARVVNACCRAPITRTLRRRQSTPC